MIESKYGYISLSILFNIYAFSSYNINVFYLDFLCIDNIYHIFSLNTIKINDGINADIDNEYFI